MVLVYIPALALFIASIFYNVLDEYVHWFGNLVFMLSFFVSSEWRGDHSFSMQK